MEFSKPFRSSHTENYCWCTELIIKMHNDFNLETIAVKEQ
jgi:hypothetical protein